MDTGRSISFSSLRQVTDRLFNHSVHLSKTRWEELKGSGSRAASALLLLPLFTGVRGRGILRSPFAGSYIDRPPRGVRMASKALLAAWRRYSCGVGRICRETNARALSLTPQPLSQDVCRRRRIFGE